MVTRQDVDGDGQDMRHNMGKRKNTARRKYLEQIKKLLTHSFF
jgi:hypothetical protein